MAKFQVVTVEFFFFFPQEIRQCWVTLHMIDCWVSFDMFKCMILRCFSEKKIVHMKHGLKY